MDETRDQFVEPELVKHEEKLSDVTAQPPAIGSADIIEDATN